MTEGDAVIFLLDFHAEHFQHGVTITSEDYAVRLKCGPCNKGVAVEGVTPDKAATITRRFLNYGIRAQHDAKRVTNW